jgi:hypothetical protein
VTLSDDGGLAERLLRWLADHHRSLDALMAQEGSRAMHEEFLMAEGAGVLPDRAERLERARRASNRAWLRHLADGLAQVMIQAPDGFGPRVEKRLLVDGERLEAICLEERAALERRGLSGDPEGDRRAAEMAGQRRFFAEAVAAGLELEEPPVFGRRVAAWGAENADRLRSLEAEALAASGARSGPASAGPEELRQPWDRAPDLARASEAAAVWANVRFLVESLEAVLAEEGR